MAKQEEGLIPLGGRARCHNCGKKRVLYQPDDAAQAGLEEIWACKPCIDEEGWEDPKLCWACDECGGFHPNTTKVCTNAY